MLTKEELDRHCDKLGLSAEARRIIDEVRSSPPSRRVASAAGNVSVQFQSRKMGHTVQAESHQVELPGAYEKEFDDNTLEYWDQPPPIKLTYPAKNGRPVGVLSTADYFVIEKDAIGWEEWKPSDKLPVLAEKMPNRFIRDGNRWCCPPGEEYAAKFGFFFRVRSSADINWVLQRNLIFLEDYLHAHAITLDERMVTSTISQVAGRQGITLEALLALENVSSDVVFTMIARGQLYVDLRAHILAEPERVPVFRDQETAKGYDAAMTLAQKVERPFITLVIGSSIRWDGQPWIITNIGETETSLLQNDGTHVDIPNVIFDKYVKSGKISNSQDCRLLETHPIVKESLAQASPSDFEEANRRLEVITPYLDGNPSDHTPTTRTNRRYIRNWRNAQDSYGCGYVGLLRQYRASGNRQPKLPENTVEMINDYVVNHYETVEHKGIPIVFGELQKECEEKGIMAPSYKSFTKAIHRRPQEKQTEAREGKRAAYQKKPFYKELTMTTPRHGDRPFEICHIDHTELDIELICSRTGRNLGRPWLTIMTDAHSRRFLAVTLSFDRPGYRACMAVLRECVRLHSRLSQIVVVDGGREFSSTYFETFLARYRIHKKVRPGAQPRYGSVCERLFGTTNTRFIHNLLGNTQVTRNIRQVTKAVNPKSLAVWTLPALYARMCEWAHEVYDTIDHPALGQTPREAFTMGLKLGGERLHKLIPYDDDFLIFTMPTTIRGIAKINAQSGVKINYIHYWSNTFRDPDLSQVKVPIRYEPLNAGIAYAYVKKQWVKCTSEYYNAFAGKSQREIQLATDILRRQNQLHNKRFTVTARKLADFLTSTEAEQELLKQRLQDGEYKEMLRLKGSSFDEEPEGPDQEMTPNPHESDEPPNEESEENDTDFDTYQDF